MVLVASLDTSHHPTLPRCVDPLDGTTNFSHQYPAFAVSVGVMRGSQPVAGAVVEFAGGPGTWVMRSYAASLGGGATLNGRPIHTSSVDKINESLLVGGSVEGGLMKAGAGGGRRGVREAVQRDEDGAGHGG